VEFRHEASDRYVVTMLAAEIEALDRGRIPGWTRTGESFEAWINREPAMGWFGYYYEQPEGLHPVCRLYLPPPAGPEHFFSASGGRMRRGARPHPGHDPRDRRGVPRHVARSAVGHLLA
jgi:hypothetical protein